LSGNAFTGELPGTWLSVQDGAARPLVHTDRIGSAFPALKALLLARNGLVQDVYVALQTVLTWPSLATLDIVGNALVGSLQEALDLRYCSGDGVGGSCGGTVAAEPGAGEHEQPLAGQHARHHGHAAGAATAVPDCASAQQYDWPRWRRARLVCLIAGLTAGWQHRARG
jgi:hypothetical protein